MWHPLKPPEDTYEPLRRVIYFFGYARWLFITPFFGDLLWGQIRWSLMKYEQEELWENVKRITYYLGSVWFSLFVFVIVLGLIGALVLNLV